MRLLPLVLFMLGMPEGLALAEPSEHASAKASVTAPTSEDKPAIRDAGSQKNAQELLTEAKRRYQKGDVNGAIELLKQCYELTHDANLLFNLAQVYRELDDCELALEHYQRYIKQYPKGRRVADSEKYITDLESRCKVSNDAESPPSAASSLPSQPIARTPAPQTAPAASVTPKAVPEQSNPWPAIAGVSFGAGVLTAVATTYFGIAAHQAKSDVEQIQTQKGFDTRYLSQRLDDFYRDRNWAFGMGVAFGVTAAAGTYALAKAAHLNGEHLRSVSVSITPQGTTLGYQLSF